VLRAQPIRRVSRTPARVQAVSPAPAAPLPMSRVELIAVGESVFGKRWLRPLARIAGCDPRQMLYYKTGERIVSASVAASIRAFMDIGQAGAIIRKAVKDSCAGLSTLEAHLAARRVVVELKQAGLIGDWKA
jgi:hypothetical protein